MTDRERLDRKMIYRKRKRMRSRRNRLRLALFFVILITATTAVFVMIQAAAVKKPVPAVPEAGVQEGDASGAAVPSLKDGAATAPAPETDSSQAVPQQTPVPPPSLADDTQAEPSGELSWDKTVFIGDSLTEGLAMFSGVSQADLLFKRGLRISDLPGDTVTDFRSGEEVLATDVLKSRSYDRIIVLLGLSELGWDNADVFEQRYTALIDRLMQLQPQAQIFLHEILPVSQERSDTDHINNNSDIAQYNTHIRAVAQAKQLPLLTVSSELLDENGCLRADITNDGVHLKASYYPVWLEAMGVQIYQYEN